jgi:hypothetical protein
MTRWGEHENYIKTLLHLDGTVSSGSKFHDPGDAVAREHYLDRAYRFYAECKSTINKSFSLKRDSLLSHEKRAKAYGKMFLLPVRFYADGTHDDFVVLRAEDFAELAERAEAASNNDAARFLDWTIDHINNTRIKARAQHALRVLTGDS